jgi:enediyne biosynthesis protein E4
VLNGARMTSLEKPGPEYWNRLFRNNGGTFTDVTKAACVAGRGYELGVVTEAYDHDDDVGQCRVQRWQGQRDP